MDCSVSLTLYPEGSIQVPELLEYPVDICRCASQAARLAHQISRATVALGWAPGGFAAIPTTALDPPHSAASPAVPALIGSGSPSRCLLNFGNLLEFLQQIGMKLCQVAHNPGIIQ